jgi:hypothetical protein
LAPLKVARTTVNICLSSRLELVVVVSDAREEVRGSSRRGGSSNLLRG